MERLFEYIQNHPLLTAATLLIAAAAVVFEARTRRQSFSAVSPQEAIRLMNQGAQVLDIRSAEAFSQGHIAGARHATSEQIAQAADSLRKYREKILVVCDDTGSAGATAVRTLHGQGFSRVFNLRGGLTAWRAEALPLQRG